MSYDENRNISWWFFFFNLICRIRSVQWGNEASVFIEAENNVSSCSSFSKAQTAGQMSPGMMAMSLSPITIALAPAGWNLSKAITLGRGAVWWEQSQLLSTLPSHVVSVGVGIWVRAPILWIQFFACFQWPQRVSTLLFVWYQDKANWVIPYWMASVFYRWVVSLSVCAKEQLFCQQWGIKSSRCYFA